MPVFLFDLLTCAGSSTGCSGRLTLCKSHTFFIFSFRVSFFAKTNRKFFATKRIGRLFPSFTAAQLSRVLVRFFFPRGTDLWIGTSTTAYLLLVLGSLSGPFMMVYIYIYMGVYLRVLFFFYLVGLLVRSWCMTDTDHLFFFFRSKEVAWTFLVYQH